MAEMGTLVVGKLDLNDSAVVARMKAAIQTLVQDAASYRALRFKPQYYFAVEPSPIPSAPGWYVVLDGKLPLYVGKADNLNGRLNTNTGSVDSFAERARARDGKRNFIKKLDELGSFSHLRVCLILESQLLLALGMNRLQLNNLDRANVEKLIDILRSHFTYR